MTTKWNHAQADKLERREQKLRASEHSCTSTSNLTSPGSLGGGIDSIIALIKEEIQWLSRLPFTQLGTLLHFIHDPIHHGDFNWPSEEDMAVPNRGLYALSGELRCNSAFILAEHRCCLLLWRVRTELKSSAVTDDLIDLIFDELSRLNRRKKADWTQRRAHVEQDRVVFSTGKAAILSSIIAHGFAAESYFERQGPIRPVVKAVYLLSVIMQDVFFMTFRAS